MMLSFALLSCLSLLALGVLFTRMALRAGAHPAAREPDFPRWSIRLGWLLAVEFGLFGLGLAMLIAHAALVYMEAAQSDDALMPVARPGAQQP